MQENYNINMQKSKGQNYINEEGIEKVPEINPELMYVFKYYIFNNI